MMFSPFIRWVGGKRWLAPKLVEIFESAPFAVYHEPFVGGGAAFFALAPPRAFLNDASEDLISTYLAVRDHADTLINGLFVEGVISAERYKEYAEASPATLLTGAMRFLYLNRASFNGLWRVNNKGKFNVPLDKGKIGQLVLTADLGSRLRGASAALQHAELSSEDFTVALSKVRSDDLVYVDPPYNGAFGGYTSKAFDVVQQERLSAEVHRLQQAGARVVMSTSDTEFSREWFEPLFVHREVVKRPGTVSCKADGRQPVPELLLW